MKKEDYWSKNEYQLFNELDSSREGLTQEEVDMRLNMYGYNRLKRKRFKTLSIFIRQFKNPFIGILFFSIFISMLLGDVLESLIIFIMVFLSSLLSFYNEYRSEKIVENLNKKIEHKAIVMRDGKKYDVNVSMLVPGDIVYLAIGSIVPADLRIIESKNLLINESVLTGESNPVVKDCLEINAKALKIQDMKNYAFAGSIVSSGEGVGIILKTGQNTEFGKISKEVVNERPETEFQKDLGLFGGLLFKVILYLTIGIFFINAVLKQNIISSLLFSLAIAIGLTPELLPVILTVSLSKGAKLMSKKDVIVKRLISIEDFGNMDILCTDKTGTLTEGNLELREHVNYKNENDEKVLLYGLLCNSTIVHGKRYIGDPIDIAIYKHTNEKLKSEMSKYEKLDVIPFDYERKKMSVIAKIDKDTKIITKGSFNNILKSCKRINADGKEVSMMFYKKKIEKKYMEFSNKGYRVIAVAYKNIKEKKDYGPEDEEGMVFLGFISFFDPPKKNIKKHLDMLEDLNIKLKILTGDNEIITKKIAEEVDIEIRRIVLADEIDKLNDDKLRIVVEEADAFCRLNPNQKLRIIKALKENGHDVGYMGDGVNDVPALHMADVGISVNDAVDVTKEASDIILIKKSLISLADGVIEGRKTFNNTIKYILMGTSSNFGNMFSAAGASIFLPFLPMLPMQILLVNLLYDFSQVTISSDLVDEEDLKKPKKFKIDFIKKYMIIIGPISSIYDFLTYFVMLFVFKASQSLFRTGWFIESLATQLLVVFIIRTKRVPFYKSKPGKYVVWSTLISVFIALIIPFTPIAGLLGFERPPLMYFIILILMVITYLFLVEIVKYYFFKRYEI